MSVALLVSELTNMGVRFWKEGDQVRFLAPKGVMNAERLAALRARKDEVRDYLSRDTTADLLKPDPEAAHEPFPLTDVQSAYLLGRTEAFAYGGVACHGYVELAFPDIDPERLDTAWARLVSRHGMLRAVVHPDGYQQVLPNVTPAPIRVADLRRRGAEELARAVEQTRAELSHRVYRTDQWPLHELRVTRGDGRALLHASIDLLIADSLSVQRLLWELHGLYRDPGLELPLLEVTVRDYVLAHRRMLSSGGASSAEYERDRAYFWQRIDDLPPAPEMPICDPEPSGAEVRFRRHSLGLSKENWAALRRRAGANDLTPSGAVLAAYAEIISRWSRRPRFTLNLTVLTRLPIHPQVDQLVGDFTSVSLLAVDRSQHAPFADWAKELQARLWQDMDHRLCSGIEVLRELGRRRGRADALMGEAHGQLGRAGRGLPRWVDRGRIRVFHRLVEKTGGGRRGLALSHTGGAAR